MAPAGKKDILESLESSSMLTANHSVQTLQGLFSNIAAPEAILFAGSLLWVLLVPVLTKPHQQPSVLSRLIARVSLAVGLAFAGLIVLGMVSRQVHNWHWRMLLPFAALCFALALAGLIEQAKTLSADTRSRSFAAMLGAALTVTLMAMAVHEGYHSFRDPAKQPVESLLQLGQIERVYEAVELDSRAAPWTILAIGSPPEQSYARSLSLTLQRVLLPGSSLSLASSEAEWLQGPVLYYLEGPQIWIEKVATSLGQSASSPLWRGDRSLAWRLDSREQALAAADLLCGLSDDMRLRVDRPRDQFALLRMVGLATDSDPGQPLSKSVSCLRLAP
jgi:hypothetical protein